MNTRFTFPFYSQLIRPSRLHWLNSCITLLAAHVGLQRFQHSSITDVSHSVHIVIHIHPSYLATNQLSQVSPHIYLVR